MLFDVYFLIKHHMKVFKYACSLVSLWLLTACGSTIPRLDMSYKGTDAATIVASVSDYRTSYSHMALLIRAKSTASNSDEPLRGAIAYSLSFSKKPDFHIGYEHGDVLVSTLPPGEYEIYGFEAVQTGLITITGGSRKLTPVTLSLRAGEVLYIGSYTTTMLSDRFFGMPEPTLPRVKISDQSQRDISIARARAPALPETVRKFIPKASDFGSSIFSGD